MMAEHKKKSVGRDALIPPGRNANHLPLFIRHCVGNHPSPALPELPSKGSRRRF